LKATAIIWSAGFSAQDGQAIVTRRVYEQQNLRWRECIYLNGGGGLSYLSWVLTVFKLFFHTMAERNASIYAVVSRSNVGFLRDIPVLAMALFGRRVICHFHGSDVLNLLSESRFRWLARCLYRNCILIVPSQHLLIPLKEMSRTKVIVCENPAVRNYPAHEDKIRTAPSNVPVLIWNSNMLASKGFANTLLAVSEINADGCKVDFVTLGRVLGDHEMSADKISALLAKFEHEAWLRLVGAVSNEEAFERTSHSDIVALPSWYRSECQPLAIMQAMCLGKAIVSSPTAAMQATLGDYPAFIAHEPTVSAVKAAILNAVWNIEAGNFGADVIAPQAERARLRFSPQRFDEQMAALLLNTT
jgi:glycosyltransferase involved in cell wall biosynthesis